MVLKRMAVLSVGEAILVEIVDSPLHLALEIECLLLRGILFGSPGLSVN
jgi:hypothetical protein